MSETPLNPAELRVQATGLRLHGLLAHWSEVMADADAAQRIAQWLRWEADERGRRSLERSVAALERVDHDVDQRAAAPGGARIGVEPGRAGAHLGLCWFHERSPLRARACADAMHANADSRARGA